MSVSICSLNCKGLQSNSKRQEVFTWMRDKPYSVYFLQETHCGEGQDVLWKNEWGAEAHFSAGSTNSQGVGIMIKNGIDFELKDAKITKRYIILDTVIDNKPMLLVNLYAPNEDDNSFFKIVEGEINNFETTSYIIGGDFNTVMDIDMDKKGGSLVDHYVTRRQEINKWMNNLDCVEIWRTLHPDGKRYTWRQRRPFVQCRLDYFLISTSLVGCVEQCDIRAGFKTDHSLITLQLQINDLTRGRGFWKFNAKLLTDMEYVKMIQQTISDTKITYDTKLN